MAEDLWACAQAAAEAVANLSSMDALAALEMARVSVEAEIQSRGQ